MCLMRNSSWWRNNWLKQLERDLAMDVTTYGTHPIVWNHANHTIILDKIFKIPLEPRWPSRTMFIVFFKKKRFVSKCALLTHIHETARFKPGSISALHFVTQTELRPIVLRAWPGGDERVKGPVTNLKLLSPRCRRESKRKPNLERI